MENHFIKSGEATFFTESLHTISKELKNYLAQLLLNSAENQLWKLYQTHPYNRVLTFCCQWWLSRGVISMVYDNIGVSPMVWRGELMTYSHRDLHVLGVVRSRTQ
jgi:hypothetical protein